MLLTEYQTGKLETVRNGDQSRLTMILVEQYRQSIRNKLCELHTNLHNSRRAFDNVCSKQAGFIPAEQMGNRHG